jgi:hypothetical protein
MTLCVKRNLNHVVVPLMALTVGMSSCTPSPTGSDQATAVTSASSVPQDPSVIELEVSNDPLAAGTYVNSDFSPRVSFAVSGDWYAVQKEPGFFDVQQDVASSHVIAVQFANVVGVYHGDGAAAPPAGAAEAVELIESRPDLTVLGSSDALMDGREGFVVEVEIAGQDPTTVLDTPAGALSIDHGRRLWIALFDVDGGVLAILVGGSSEGWEEALATAEPVLESVTIGG